MARWTRMIGVLAALSSAGVASADDAPPEPPVSQCDGVVLELRNAVVSKGNVTVEAVLRNTSKTAYPLIATMDGSSFGRRNPTITFSITTDRTKEVGLCGLVNAMTDADFFTLQPGQTKRLEWVHPPTPASPGVYELRATYDNDPKRSLRGKQNGEEKFAARIAATIPCRVTSEPIKLKVR